MAASLAEVPAIVAAPAAEVEPARVAAVFPVCATDFWAVHRA